MGDGLVYSDPAQGCASFAFGENVSREEPRHRNNINVKYVVPDTSETALLPRC